MVELPRLIWQNHTCKQFLPKWHKWIGKAGLQGTLDELVHLPITSIHAMGVIASVILRPLRAT